MSNAFSGGAPSGSSNGSFSGFSKGAGPPRGGFGNTPAATTNAFGSKTSAFGTGTFGSSQTATANGNNAFNGGSSTPAQPQSYGPPRGGFNPHLSNGQAGSTTANYNNNAQATGGFRSTFDTSASTGFNQNNGQTTGYQQTQQQSQLQQKGGFQGSGYQSQNHGYGEQKQATGGFHGGGTGYEQGQNNGGYGGQQQEAKGGFHGGGTGGYQGQQNSYEQQQQQSRGGFVFGQGPPLQQPAQPVLQQHYGYNTGGYGGEPQPQQQQQQNGTHQSPNAAPGSFQAANNEQFENMPVWSMNTKSLSPPKQPQQQQYNSYNNGTQGSGGGYSAQQQQPPQQMPQQPAQEQRGGFHGGNAGGYGGYGGQQQQQAQPQYGGFQPQQQEQKQFAQPGLFSQHRSNSSQNQEFQQNSSNFDANNGSNGYQKQDESVFSREAGFQKQQDIPSASGARGGFHGGSSGAPNNNSGGFQPNSGGFQPGSQFQQGNRGFGASGASQKQTFEGKSEWSSPRSTPTSGEANTGGFGAPRRNDGGFGAPKRSEFQDGRRNFEGGAQRRNQPEPGFQNFGDDGDDGRDQQNSFQNGGAREFRRGGGGHAFGGNEGNGEQRQDGEERILRAPRDWMPRAAEVDQLYAYDHDVVEQLENGADEESIVVNGAKDQPITSWDNMGFDEMLVRTLKDKCRFPKPRRIQASVIPLIATGKDVIVQAVTGSGKTLSFALPILDKILKLSPEERADKMRSPVAMIIEPTRELAGQVYDCFRRFTEGTDIRVVLAIGQKCRMENMRELVQGVDVLVATAGRCMDFFATGELSFDRLAFFVLDEADRMLDPRDAEHLNTVINSPLFRKTVDKRQTFLFSATLAQNCVELAIAIMREQKIISVKNGDNRMANSLVQHEFYELIGAKEKHKKLKEILAKDQAEGKTVKTLIFTDKKANANFLAFEIINMNFPDVCALTGDAPQDTRDETYNKFRNGEISVLVATDVASRGLDINNLERVIQYEMPSTKIEGVQSAADKFIHRVGRTGRGHKGIAISFIDPSLDRELAKEIIKIVRSCNQEPPEFLEKLAESTPESSNDGTFGSAAGAGFGNSGGFGTSSGGGGAKSAFGATSGGGSGGFGTSGSFGNAGGFGTTSGGTSGGFGTTSGGTSGGFGNSGTFGGGGFGGSSAPANDGFGSLKLKEKTSDDVTDNKNDVTTGFGSSEASTFGSAGFGSSFGGEKKDDVTTGKGTSGATTDETGSDVKEAASGTTLVVNDEVEATAFEEKPFRLPPEAMEQPADDVDEEDDVNDDATLYGSDEVNMDDVMSEAGSAETAVLAVTHKLKEAALEDEKDGSDVKETGSDVTGAGNDVKETGNDTGSDVNGTESDDGNDAGSEASSTGNDVKEPEEDSGNASGNDVKDEIAPENKDVDEVEEKETDW